MREAPSPERFKDAYRPYQIVWALVLATVLAVDLIILFALNSGVAINSTGTSTALGTVNAIGFVALSGVNAIGLVAVSPVNAVGIIAVGGTSAAGFIAIGGVNSAGFIAISGVNAVGFIAIGRRPLGVYALSYTGNGMAKHMLSPDRQDAKAAALFGRLSPKLNRASEAPF